MGTWGTAIKSNDTSADTYADFFDLYNDGKEPTEIKNKLITENQDGTNDFWFALALALWETKSLSNDILEKVRGIIKNESDLKLWRELDASESDIKKRKAILDKFLVKLESEKPKPKARKKKKNKQPFFETGTCLIFKLENGNYGGAIVLSSDLETGYGCNLILTTRINQLQKPSLYDIENSEVLIKDFGDWEKRIDWTWFYPESLKDFFCEPIGKLIVKKKYGLAENLSTMGLSSNSTLIKSSILRQMEFENKNGKTKTFPTKRLMKKNWWQIF